MSAPPGIEALMLDGQRTDGRTNQPRNEISPSTGDSVPVAEAAIARPNAVVQTIPTVRYARAAASRRRPSRAMFRRMVAR
jgi:hypothetical protein